ncbi:hypothetical protein AB6888_13995 [Carnobacterium maltaromaticum]
MYAVFIDICENIVTLNTCMIEVVYVSPTREIAELWYEKLVKNI